ncbi:C-C motif chemokine 3-like [Antechinus flavipes]|uniref:C-C motif chemokine 3-like n=1 Tax=Antechinus flavipes TaxID=38775 RepID=UPI002235AA97|nr:C-C motif chemokine 3-like [Antechinus flavipes]
MKFFVVALSILMVMAFNFPESSAILSPTDPGNCCFRYVSIQIPRKLVIRSYETNSQCSQPGVVFVTKMKREICANPNDAWVQNYVNDLKLKASGVQNNES